MYDDAQDAVAAEYVLGTLSAEEREHAEALLTIDPGFAEAVRMWERRLGELNVMVEAMQPPAQVWDKIRTELGLEATISDVPSPMADGSSAGSLAPPITGGEPASPAAADALDSLPAATEWPASQSSGSVAPSLAQMLGEPATQLSSIQPVSQPDARIERSADVVDLSRRVGYWRSLTAALGAIAALLAIFIAVALFAPGLVPLGRLGSPRLVAQTPAAAPSVAQLVAVLQQEPMSPAFLVTIDTQARALIVRRVSAGPEAGRSYELWLISTQFPKPRSLGVVGNDEFTRRAIPGSIDVDTMRAAKYAISLEPTGGSQSGVPTGPILFTGQMVESVPASSPHTHT